MVVAICNGIFFFPEAEQSFAYFTTKQEDVAEYHKVSPFPARGIFRKAHFVGVTFCAIWLVLPVTPQSCLNPLPSPKTECLRE